MTAYAIVGAATITLTPAATKLRRYKGKLVGASTITLSAAAWLRQYNYKIAGASTITLSTSGTMAYRPAANCNMAFPALSLSATGYITPQVTCNLSFPVLSVESLGAAAAALSLSALSIDATGSAELVANGSIPFSTITVTATATAHVNAAAALGFASFTLTARGGANALLSTPLFYLDASTTGEANFADATVEFPALSLSATATLDNTANGELEFPAFSFPHVDASLEFPLFSVSGSSLVSAANLIAFVTNLRTLETTVYDNFAFSDIILVDNIAYGVKPTGLFSFDATTDSGTAINGSITTKETDFGTAKSKRVNEIFLNSDTATTIRPKVDGVWAPLAYPSSFGGRRATLPRGLEGRYWAFQINKIQQLEGLELVPDIRQRRIK